MPIRSERMVLYPGGSIRSPEWSEIRARIQRRADNRCEGCGVRNHALGGRLDGVFYPAQPTGTDGVRVTWPRPGDDAWCGEGMPTRLRVIRIVCTVAHVDGDETNNDDANLRFWCQQCHNRHDAKARARNAAARRRKGLAAGDLFGEGDLSGDGQ